MKKLLLIVIACLSVNGLGLSVAHASQMPNQHQRQELQETLHQSKANVVLLVNGRTKRQPLVLTNSTVDKKSPQRLSADWLFPIGSTQKWLTGLMVLRAIKAGHLSLNTTLNHYYPQVNDSDKITIFRLLTHTSGLADQGRFAEQVLTNQQQQESYSLSHYQSTGGTGWQYASINYVLLAGILSKVYHCPYHDLLNQELARPAHLHDFKFYYQIHNAQEVPSSLLLTGDQGTDWQHLQTQLSTTLGAGDLLITPRDYWRLLNYTLDHYRPEFHQIVTSKVDTPSHYFAGFYVNGNQLHDNGTVDGYTCNVYTDRHRSMMIFSNSLSSQQTDELCGQLAQIYFQNK